MRKRGFTTSEEADSDEGHEDFLVASDDIANLADTFREHDCEECVGMLRQVYRAKNRNQALLAYRRWLTRRGQVYPRFTAELELDLDKLLTFFAYSNAHWEYIRTNNSIEKLMPEIRSRTWG
ncbi:MAG: transposase [Armatimonadota bacterium]